MGQQIVKQTFIIVASVIIGTVEICLSTLSFREFSELYLICSLLSEHVHQRLFFPAFRIKTTNCFLSECHAVS